MRSAQVLYNGIPAGILSKAAGRYRFIYDKNYLTSTERRPVSLTMPLQEAAYESDFLFPVFVNMLSEGANKAMQCRLLKIDENDYFGLLLATAGNDNIGPISIKEIYEPAGN
jgi:HipA-like protein